MLAPDDVITVEELCARLKVKKVWVYEKMRKHDIPAFKMGRYLRFSWTEISKWIECQRVDLRIRSVRVKP
jgi:excisionase family DNA binding protein